MVAGAEVIRQSVPSLDVQYRCTPKGIDEIVDLVATVTVTPPVSPTLCRQAARGTLETAAASELNLRATDVAPNLFVEAALVEFVPTIRSGSFIDIGLRRYMEDEHIRIDDLSAHLGYMFTCPTPSAFYGVFDGHGGPEAAAYIKRHAVKFFFEDSEFPQASVADKMFLEFMENSVQKAFLLADLALADECSVSTSCGTTALTALVFGRHLMVANAGDCRAVLCRKGEAVEMSRDHRPIYAAERRRVEGSGGYVDDGGYLNGLLSVSRGLGDWDMKLPKGSLSPLIAEPEFRQLLLTEDDEFLIIGCDGIWDVMSSQHAISIVRQGLRRHDDPEQCARELVKEALRLNTSDNLTVIIVCFASEFHDSPPLPKQPPSPQMRCCSLSTEALCNLRNWLERDGERN